VNGPEDMLLGFAEALRVSGVPVTPDRGQAFCRAVSLAGLGDQSAVYWSGRATLCASRDDVDRYDTVFAAWFASDRPTGGIRREQQPRRVLRPDLAGGRQGEAAEVTEYARAVASEAEVLRHRDVADLDATERRLLDRLLDRLVVRPPTRSSPRLHAHRRGRVDAGRTLREQLRRAGEPGPLRHRRRGRRPRRVVLLVDVSGSMEPYADHLLRLAHRMVQAAPTTTEVLTMGTRLTRVTGALRRRDGDAALRAAGLTVPDWSGGTRLGEMLRAFLDRHGQRGMARGAVVVVFSDGWERGDPLLLGEQVARLRRMAHRLVWVNPHRGKAGYLPVQGGIVAVLPHVDELLAGHSLATFEELLEVVRRA
jgi:uncharacterized protein with von Willebrand factor type A (vWA) domain